MKRIITINFVQFSDNRIENLKTVTKEDQEMSALREIVNGWPEKWKQVPKPLQP